MHNRHLNRCDTHFQKLCKSIVGHPPGTGWTFEWQEMHHASSEGQVGSGQGSSGVHAEGGPV